MVRCLLGARCPNGKQDHVPEHALTHRCVATETCSSTALQDNSEPDQYADTNSVEKSEERICSSYLSCMLDYLVSSKAYSGLLVRMHTFYTHSSTCIVLLAW